MCGIVGILDKAGVGFPEEIVLGMIQDLAHRGPDGDGMARRGPLALGHRRLSILDPAGGRQPMFNEDGNVWVTYNGEIYNFKEIARELTERGHVFRTHCDTEVVVHAWEEWGEACVGRFRGMFAFGIADWRRGILFLARDHFGIKPLEWISTPHAFAFSSENVPLRRTPGFRPDLDRHAIDEYLWFQYITAPRTGFEQIRKLPPGNSMIVGLDGKVHEPKEYWNFRFEPEAGRDRREWIERIDEVVKDSVAAHLVSDVPFGAFLSGGVDSSLIVAEMSKILDRPVETFSIGNSDPEFDETSWARIASEATGSHHHVEIVEPQALEILPELVRHYGEPFADSSAIPTWHVSRLARRHVPMVLSGDGADELFGGYWSYGDWMAASGGNPGPWEIEDWLRHINYMDPAFRTRLWKQGALGARVSLPEVFAREWARSEGASPLHRVQHMDLKTYLPSAILKKVDIASMMHGLETRTPFVDVRVAELVSKIPSDHSLVRNADGSWDRKRLLKEVASRHFPIDFLNRPKMGFAIPVVKWFRPGTPLWTGIARRLLAADSPLAEFLEADGIREVLQHRHAANIWQLLFLDEWLRQAAAATPAVARTSPVVEVTRKPPSPPRPRILIVADVPNWIFERHARTLQKALADEFEIDVAFQGQGIDESRYDLVYPLEWNLVPPEEIGNPRKWITGIRSHISWQDRDPGWFSRLLRTKFSKVHAVSRRLSDLIAAYRPDVLTLTHGVDLEHFGTESEPFVQPGRLRIGWAGNRKSPAKGFEEFIAPLGDLPGVELHFCGYSDRLLTREEMMSFYEGIDVYVCSSSTEGNNNSLLEAAATGRAIITTDVGTVPEYLEHGRSALVVPRTPEAFREAVQQLLEDPSRGRELGRAARVAVRKFSWAVKMEEHRRFLRAALELSRAVEGVPTDLEGMLARVEEMVDARDFPAAKSLLREIDARHPGRGADRILAKLEAAIPDRGRSERPERTLARALEEADARFLAGDAQGALDALSEGRDGLEETLEVVNARAWLLTKVGRLAQAQVEYLNAARKWPAVASVHANLAGILILRGMGEQARPHLLKVLELSPGDPEALTALRRLEGQPEAWSPSFSFCLITNGERIAKLRRVLESIRSQHGFEVEILVAGILPPLFDDPGISFQSLPDAAKNGRLGEMRNAMVERARGDVVVVCDDDIVFDDDFCRNVAAKGADFDILCARIRNLDGSRFWDWAINGEDRHRLLPYGETHPDIYVTGGLCVARPHVFSRCRWNQALGFYQSEDLDFTAKLKSAGMRIESWPSAQVTHFDHRYTQFEDHIIRVDSIRESVADLTSEGRANPDRYGLAQRLVRFAADQLRDRPGFLEEMVGITIAAGMEEETALLRGRLESMVREGVGLLVWPDAREPSMVSRYLLHLLPFLANQKPFLRWAESFPCPVSEPLATRLRSREFPCSRALSTIDGNLEWESILDAVRKAAPALRELVFLAAQDEPAGFPRERSGVALKWVRPGAQGEGRTIEQIVSDPRALEEVSEWLAGVLEDRRAADVVSLEGRVEWTSPVLNFTGYARMNRDLIQCLEDSGVRPGLAPLDTDPGYVDTLGGSPGELLRWKQALERAHGSGVLVCSHLAGGFPSIRSIHPGHRRYVGLTMFETDRLPAGWASACESMDEIWVPSRFNLETFANAGVSAGKLQVVPYGMDLRRWNPATEAMEIPGARGFVFLAVFEWTLRKGWDILVESFARGFGADADVCLVLRTRRPPTDATPIRDQIDRLLRDKGVDPLDVAPILILEEPIPDERMASLYAACDVVVLPTRGEGWGLPFMEAMAMEKPVVATAWGAHMDFLDETVGWMIPVERLETVSSEQTARNPLYGSDHRWALPSIASLTKILGDLPGNREELLRRGRAGRARLARDWTTERSASWMRERLSELARSADSEGSPRTEVPGEEPRILVKAGFFDFSGYSRLARDAALSLEAQGGNVGIHAFLREPRFLEGLANAPGDLAAFQRLLQGQAVPEVAVAWFPPTVWHGKDVYQRFREENPGCRHFVAMTMFETDGLPSGWAERCNQMDEIWVPTRFNLESFARAGVDRHRLKVIPFGLRLSDYDPAAIAPVDLGAGEDFVFLSIFQWSWRKGWDLLIEAFAREFSGDEKVRLVLRTYPLGDPEPSIRTRIDAFLAERGLGHMSARIFLVDEFVSDARMPSLIQAGDCFVLPTRGEGWGIPLLEAMALAKPVIATRWSGHLEFMDDSNAFLVDIEGLEEVQEQMRADSDLYERGQNWARPSLAHLRSRMREVFDAPREAEEIGRKARRSVLASRDCEETASWIRRRAREIVSPDAASNRRVVAVDVRCLFDSDTRDRGIGHYTEQHLLALERNSRDVRFLFLAPEGANPALVGEHLRSGKVELVPFSRFRPESADILHIPDPMGNCEGRMSPFSIPFQGAKTTVFYDLIPRRFYLDHWPQDMRDTYTARLEEALRFDGTHLCISRSTREDVVAEGVDPARARWIGAGLNLESAAVPLSDGETDSLLRRLGVRGAFFLQVGALDAHKNFQGSLATFLATREKIPCQLVVVGRRKNAIGWWERVCREKGIPDVVFADFLPRRELEALYRRAAALLFLSRIEGFGFPVLEAMAAGCPAITYDNSSLREVGGEVACIAPDGDEVSVVRYMLQLLSDPGERERRSLAGRERSSLFSWDDVARRTLEEWGWGDESGDALPKDPVASADVVWAAPVFDPSGYGDEARGFLRNLGGFSDRVAVRSIGRTSERFRQGMDVADRGRFDAMVSRESRSGATLVVSFPAGGFRRFPEMGTHVGRTMFETDSIPREWVSACESLDEIWVPTEFNLRTFRGAGVRKPLLKIPAGVDAERFRPGLEPLDLPGPKAGTTYLSVFEWTARKGWDVLLAGWAEAFGPSDDVRLVVRAYPPNAIEGDMGRWVEERIENHLASIGTSRDRCAPIVVLGAQIPDSDMPRLYAAADVYLAPSRGEGWGRPHMEAMSCGVPVIATRWSGNLEFQDEDNSWLIDVDAVVPVGDEMEFGIYKGQGWAEPSVGHFARLLQRTQRDPGEVRDKGAKARADIERRWSWRIVGPLAALRLEEIGRGVPVERSEVPLRLAALAGVPRAQSKDWIESDPEAPSIHWVGPVFNFSGYARLAREVLTAIDGVGFRCSIDPQCSDSVWLAGLGADAASGSRWKRILEQEATGDGILMVCDVPRSARGGTDLLEQVRSAHPGFRTRIAWTLFETDTLPDGWSATLGAMDQVWVCSRHNMATFAASGVDPSKLRLVPVGIDPAPFDRAKGNPLPIPGSAATTFLSVFQWNLRKGWDVLLEAWSKAFGPGEDVRLVLRCHGSPDGSSIEERLDAWCSSRGIPRSSLAPIVLADEFIPDQDMPRLYEACDVFVLPSRGEGWGLPYLEAMAAGRPVIGVPWGGAADFLHEGLGWMLPVGGTVPVSAEAIAQNPFLGPRHRWADPKVGDLVDAMRAAASSPLERRKRGMLGAEEARKLWSPEVTISAVRAALGTGAPKSSSSIEVAKPGARPGSTGRIGAHRLSGVLADLATSLKTQGRRVVRAPEAPVASSRTVGHVPPRQVPQGGAAASGELSIRWEGSQFVHHSLAHVNRELCLGLAKAGHDLSLISYEPDQFGPGEDPDLGILSALTNAPLDQPCQVHVRHQWPPNLKAPVEGRWVVVQPWEFGSPPVEWMPAFREQIDELWAYSSYVRDLYLRAGVPEDRVHVVPLGVDVERFRPGVAPLTGLPAKKGVRFLFVGGTIARKGFDKLLNAWQKAFGPSDDVELLVKDMGGATTYRGQTGEHWVRKLQESGNCATIHYTNADLAPAELPAVYASADVLVHPYRGEGFGLPIAEAMACGLPVVVTDGGAADDFCGPDEGWRIPASKEVLPGGRVGDTETVEPPWWLESSEEALVDILREVARDAAGRAAKGAAARRRIESGFTWKHAVRIAEERLRAVSRKPIRRLAAPGEPPPETKVLPSSPVVSETTGSGVDETALEALSGLLLQVEAAVVRKDFPEADHLSGEALQAHPRAQLAWLARAMVLRGMGKPAKALQALEEGLRLGDGPELRFEAMILHLQEGRNGPARVHWKHLRDRHASWLETRREEYRSQGMEWPGDRFKSGTKRPKATSRKK
ncbi:MAG: asparagine synthase (glutamine-hydrolyzing) [Fibrobacteria bacterium]|nr:asparagine synthase (glutamine-hydrolyzing) [Fibrobacteria bacterium]